MARLRVNKTLHPEGGPPRSRSVSMSELESLLGRQQPKVKGMYDREALGTFDRTAKNVDTREALGTFDRTAKNVDTREALGTFDRAGTEAPLDLLRSMLGNRVVGARSPFQLLNAPIDEIQAAMEHFSRQGDVISSNWLRGLLISRGGR